MIFLARISYYSKGGTFERNSYALAEAENKDEAKVKIEDWIGKNRPEITVVSIEVSETIK